MIFFFFKSEYEIFLETFVDFSVIFFVLSNNQDLELIKTDCFLLIINSLQHKSIFGFSFSFSKEILQFFSFDFSRFSFIDFYDIRLVMTIKK